MDIAHRLRAARTAMGKTQEQVAADAGMNVTQYNGYERGRSRPAPMTLERLAPALGTTTAALTGENEQTGEGSGPTSATKEQNLDRVREAFCGEVAELLGITPERVHLRIELR